MSETALRILIDLALDAFANQAYNQMTNENLHVGGDTSVTYSLYIVGNGYYTYYPDNEVTGVTENCTFFISDGAFSEGGYFMSGEHVKWFVGGETASGNYMDDINVIIANGTNYYLGVKSTSPGILFYPFINGGGTTPAQTELRFLTGNTPYYRANGNYSIGQYGNICSISGMTATSSPTVHQQFPDAVYVPAPVDNEITYNEYRQQAITWANAIYNFNLTVNDFPDFEQIIDMTEPETQSFTLDYDEILGEKELESILTQETYYIPEIETGFFTSPTEILLEEGEILGELESIPDFISDGVKSVWDILNIWSISGIFVGCATVAVIWALIKGK